jgi:hypothetical protein
LKFYLQKRNENHEISGKLQNTEKSNQNQNQNLIFILVIEIKAIEPDFEGNK